jgi:hypothetical protein
MAQNGFVWPQTDANDPGSLVRLPVTLIWLVAFVHSASFLAFITTKLMRRARSATAAAASARGLQHVQSWRQSLATGP